MACMYGACNIFSINCGFCVIWDIKLCIPGLSNIPKKKDSDLIEVNVINVIKYSHMHLKYMIRPEIPNILLSVLGQWCDS